MHLVEPQAIRRVPGVPGADPDIVQQCHRTPHRGDRSWLPVRELQRLLDLDSSGASQHLTALRKLGLLESRRAGTSVCYGIKDARTNQLLDVARQILTSNLEQSHALLGELAATAPAPKPRRAQRPRS